MTDVKTIFFSWQADTSTTVGRNLIERALERAAARIGEDNEVREAVRELAVDKDTQGVAGSPPIVETIFSKINGAAVFVPDLTFVGKRLDGRPTPNPNVLIEYGWALKALGHGRVVAVMNTAFGEPSNETMPFDMRHLRFPITYNCPSDADSTQRAAARDDLSQKLETALRAVLTSEHYLASLPQPAQPPAFVPRNSAPDSPGRFKPKDAVIGVRERFFDEGSKTVKLAPQPVMWLRVMPTIDPGRKWSIDEIQQKATRGTVLTPISRRWQGLSFLRSTDGFGTFPAKEDGPDPALAVVMAFDTGEIWSADACLLESTAGPDRNYVPLDEAWFTESLEEYASLLKALEISPPFRWIAGMEGLAGRGIYIPVPRGRISLLNGPQGHCLEDVVTCEGLYTPGESAAKSLRPFFEKLYQSCCVTRPAFLNGE